MRYMVQGVWAKYECTSGGIYFMWPHESRWWRTIVLRTSTSVNVANGSSILTAAYFSSLWRYQFEIFTVCLHTQKLNFPRFLRACDRLWSCYVCFPVTFGMSFVLHMWNGQIFSIWLRFEVLLECHSLHLQL